MRIDILARRWGGPNGGPDGMAIAAARLAWTLAELGHQVRAYSACSDEHWLHPRVEWIARAPLINPDDWTADLVITTIQPGWRRTATAAAGAGALHKLVYWHHHSGVPQAYGGHLALPTPMDVGEGWASVTPLPPSSWACEGVVAAKGDAVLVPGASLAKGGRIALEVARECPDLRFFVLPGRATPGELAPWRALKHVEVAAGLLPPPRFLARARVVLSPTLVEVHPLALVEAAAWGIPIVCSDLPGCHAAAPGATFLRAEAKAPEWTAALRAALGTPAKPLRLRPYSEVVAEAMALLLARSTKATPPTPAPVPVVAAPPPVAPAPTVRRRSEPIFAESDVKWTPPPRRDKPRILVLADVPNWAWGRKARSLQRCLADRFDVEIAYTTDAATSKLVRAAKHDLYHTFEVIQSGIVPVGFPFTTGITAHVAQTWEERHGSGTVAGWASRAKAFHANSKMLVSEMEKLLRRQIWYLPNGVDEDFWRRMEPRGSKALVVGHAARPSPRKGATLVAEACKRVGLELRALNRSCHNALSFDEMLAWYQGIHVLAVSSDMDGTPNPALEAAACECAVVTNPIGNMPEFIEHGVNGLMTERTIDSLADALADLARRPLNEVEEMGRAARRTIEAGWTWTIQSESYAQMWRACL